MIAIDLCVPEPAVEVELNGRPVTARVGSARALELCAGILGLAEGLGSPGVATEAERLARELCAEVFGDPSAAGEGPASFAKAAALAGAVRGLYASPQAAEALDAYYGAVCEAAGAAAATDDE